MVQFSSNDDPLDASEQQRLSRAESPSVSAEGMFTVESANQMLPLLDRIVKEARALYRDYESQLPQVRALEKMPEPSKISAFAEEVAAIRGAFQDDRAKLDACVMELESLGVQIDSLDEGAVDFPAVVNRQHILLCWKVGEPTVSHWHLRGEAFAERRELSEIATSSSLSS